MVPAGIESTWCGARHGGGWRARSQGSGGSEKKVWVEELNVVAERIFYGGDAPWERPYTYLKRMPKTEAGKYRAALEARQAQLVQALRHREEIAIQKSPDLLEETQLAADRDMAIRSLNRESGLLRDVHGALQRIADGSFGICLRCEEPINPKRL